ncbi:MAG: hypothetical protein NT033_08545 [Candidatus Omnitrophica bacterium]|nr:hypothetical protein [Candidatus Omnitrophota bacterium]
MNVAILFWCYDYIDICVERLKRIRKYASNIPIYVLFGGEADKAADFERAMKQSIDDFYVYSKAQTTVECYRWKHGDLIITDWYKMRGRCFKWDTIIIMQWDLILFAPIVKLLKDFKKDQLLLTGFRPIKEVRKRWYWTLSSPAIEEYEVFVSFLEKEYGAAQDLLASCLFIFACLPRSFLEKFSYRLQSELGFLEYTIPSLANIWGFQVYAPNEYRVENKDYRSKWSLPEKLLLKHKALSSSSETSVFTIILNLVNPFGSRLFHPVWRKYWWVPRSIITLANSMNLKKLCCSIKEDKLKKQ